MRKHGRSPNDMRPVTFEPGIQKFATGSVLVEFGDTSDLHREHRRERAVVSARPRTRLADRRIRHAAARHAHAQRPRGRPRQTDRPHQEIQRLIGRALRSVFDLEKLGARTLHIDCDVIQADGGTRTASITGAFVAAHDAVAKLLATGRIESFADHGLRRGDFGRRVRRPAGARSRLRRRLAMRYRHERRDDRQRQFRRGAGHAEGEAFSRAELSKMLEASQAALQGLFKAQAQILA